MYEKEIRISRSLYILEGTRAKELLLICTIDEIDIELKNHYIHFYHFKSLLTQVPTISQCHGLILFKRIKNIYKVLFVYVLLLKIFGVIVPDRP